MRSKFIKNLIVVICSFYMIFLSIPITKADTDIQYSQTTFEKLSLFNKNKKTNTTTNTTASVNSATSSDTSSSVNTFLTFLKQAFSCVLVIAVEAAKVTIDVINTVIDATTENTNQNTTVETYNTNTENYQDTGNQNSSIDEIENETSNTTNTSVDNTQITNSLEEQDTSTYDNDNVDDSNDETSSTAAVAGAYSSICINQLYTITINNVGYCSICSNSRYCTKAGSYLLSTTDKNSKYYARTQLSGQCLAAVQSYINILGSSNIGTGVSKKKYSYSDYSNIFNINSGLKGHSVDDAYACIKKSLEAGYPVQVHVGYDYYSSNGKHHSGQHYVMVTGFKNSGDKISDFYIVDPYPENGSDYYGMGGYYYENGKQKTYLNEGTLDKCHGSGYAYTLCTKDSSNICGTSKYENPTLRLHSSVKC